MMNRVKLFFARHAAPAAIVTIFVCLLSFITISLVILNGVQQQLEIVREQQIRSVKEREEYEQEALRRQFNTIKFSKCLLNLILINQHTPIESKDLRKCTYVKAANTEYPAEAYEPYNQIETPKLVPRSSETNTDPQPVEAKP